jgi:hypothetical protein
MIGPVVPVAVQVIEAQKKPLVLYISTQGRVAGLVRIDATSTANTIYVGKAPAGTSESASGWTITRTTFNALGVKLTGPLTATGIYANRTSLTYT